MADLQSYIGAELAIAVATTPATRDQAGYTAAGMTYVRIGKVVSIPAIGDNHNPIEVDVLDLGRIIRLIGSADGGANEVSIVSDVDDAGQQDLIEANGSNVENTFRITDPGPSNEVLYFGALVAGLRDTERTTTAYKGKTFTMLINTGILRVIAP